MGLDMYVYKINRLKEEDVAPLCGKNAEDFPDEFSWKDISEDEFPYELEDIRRFGQIIDGNVRYLLEEKIKRDHGLPDDAMHVGTWYNKDSTGFTYSIKNPMRRRTQRKRTSPVIKRPRQRDERIRKTVELSEEQIMSTYSELVPKKLFVFSKTEVLYWRKHWPLQEELSELIPVENTRYSLLTDEAVDLICKMDPRAEDVFANADEDDVFAYWPWW